MNTLISLAFSPSASSSMILEGDGLLDQFFESLLNACTFNDCRCVLRGSCRIAGRDSRFLLVLPAAIPFTYTL